MSNNNYYKELNVQSDATAQEIKTSYRKLAFEYHPDRNKENTEAADKMKAINEAYAVLSDPDKRRQYDMLYRQYGDGAYNHFRQNYSQQDIFRNSDINQIFEEMARAFGLRGFDDIFKDFHGQGHQHFEFRQNGMFGRGFVFSQDIGKSPARKHKSGLMGVLARKMFSKLTGIVLPQRGEDIHGVVSLHPEFATQGGPYAYHHRLLHKKLVVQIPKAVKDGQLIRLKGQGQEGKNGGESGDLLLKVKIKTSLIDKLKKMAGLND